MRNLIILILLAGAAYFAVTCFFDSSQGDAYATYELFAERLDSGRYQEAGDMLEPGAVGGECIRARESWQRRTNLAITQSQRSIESKQISVDGARTELSISQSTYTVPGVTPPALPDFRISQQVVLRRRAGGWRIERFREQIHALDEH